jgi:hypothetical protein
VTRHQWRLSFTISSTPNILCKSRRLSIPQALIPELLRVYDKRLIAVMATAATATLAATYAAEVPA